MRNAILPALALALGLVAPAFGAADVSPDSINGDWSQVPEYRLVPGDEITLNFGPEEHQPTGYLQREAVVRPDGRISVFPIGDVIAAGRTVRELESQLIDLLSASLKQPRVTVEVTKLAGNQVHVLGRVLKPGSYPADPFLTVAQAIAQAGGFTDDASKNSVVVFHRRGSREVSVEVLALDRMIKRGSLAADRPLQRFDIVYVPRNTIGNLNTFVRQTFDPAGTVLSTGLVGWELFHLDRVFRLVQVR